MLARLALPSEIVGNSISILTSGTTLNGKSSSNNYFDRDRPFKIFSKSTCSESLHEIFASRRYKDSVEIPRLNIVGRPQSLQSELTAHFITIIDNAFSPTGAKAAPHALPLETLLLYSRAFPEKLRVAVKAMGHSDLTENLIAVIYEIQQQVQTELYTRHILRVPGKDIGLIDEGITQAINAYELIGDMQFSSDMRHMISHLSSYPSVSTASKYYEELVHAVIRNTAMQIRDLTMNRLEKLSLQDGFIQNDFSNLETCYFFPELFFGKSNTGFLPRALIKGVNERDLQRNLTCQLMKARIASDSPAIHLENALTSIELARKMVSGVLLREGLQGYAKVLARGLVVATVRMFT